MGASPFSRSLVLRQLGEAMHKRPNILHVIYPKLMMLLWGWLLFKMSDLVVYGPQGATFWPSSMND